MSAVAFDPYWDAPTGDTGAGEVTTYRFGSVGQVHRLSSSEVLRFCYAGSCASFASSACNVMLPGVTSSQLVLVFLVQLTSNIGWES